jgi:hypothetical protein
MILVDKCNKFAHNTLTRSAVSIATAYDVGGRGVIYIYIYTYILYTL